MAWQTVILISNFESASKILSFNSQYHDTALRVPSMSSCSTASLLLRRIHCLRLLSSHTTSLSSASYIPRTVS